MTSRIDPPDEAKALAERVAKALGGRTAATAESITSGNVGAALAAAPDASEWFRGTVVAYASEVKFSVLGVDPGPVVTASCARQMAVGAVEVMDADIAVSTTGAGGPGSEEDQPPGTVFIAVAWPGGCRVREYHFDGEPSEVVHQATVRSLSDLAEVLDEDLASDRVSTQHQG